MTSATVDPTTEYLRLFSLRELATLGYGSPRTNQKLITAGSVPAVLVGNRYKVRESDLRFLAEPVIAECGDVETS